MAFFKASMSNQHWFGYLRTQAPRSSERKNWVPSFGLLTRTGSSWTHFLEKKAWPIMIIIPTVNQAPPLTQRQLAKLAETLAALSVAPGPSVNRGTWEQLQIHFWLWQLSSDPSWLLRLHRRLRVDWGPRVNEQARRLYWKCSIK